MLEVHAPAALPPPSKPAPPAAQQHCQQQASPPGSVCHARQRLFLYPPFPPPQVGDVLYMPRGCVHQAKALGSGHSAHLTISTYQRWALGDLMQVGAGLLFPFCAFRAFLASSLVFVVGLLHTLPPQPARHNA